MSEIKRYSVVAEQATNGYLGTVEIESSNGKYYRVVDVKLILENRRTPSVSADTVRELVNRIGFGCGGDFGLCNSCDAAITRAEAKMKGEK